VLCHTASKNSKFPSTEHAQFRQLTRVDTALNRSESVKLFSLGYFARHCLWRKAWTVCEPQRSSECYHRQMAWCRHQTARIRKAI